MSEINAVSLMNQMRLMATKAEGSSVEFSGAQEPFGNILQRALGDVNQLQGTSDALKTRFEKGDADVGISEVMVAMQKADLGFQATLTVRNKVVEAYQDVMSMPI